MSSAKRPADHFIGSAAQIPERSQPPESTPAMSRYSAVSRSASHPAQLSSSSLYYSLDKLRKAAEVDCRLTLREILEKFFGLIPRFKSKDELLEEEFSKLVADDKPDEATAIPAIKTYFKAYVTSNRVLDIMQEQAIY